MNHELPAELSEQHMFCCYFNAIKIIQLDVKLSHDPVISISAASLPFCSLEVHSSTLSSYFFFLKFFFYACSPLHPVLLKITKYEPYWLFVFLVAVTIHVCSTCRLIEGLCGDRFIKVDLLSVWGSHSSASLWRCTSDTHSCGRC